MAYSIRPNHLFAYLDESGYSQDYTTLDDSGVCAYSNKEPGALEGMVNIDNAPIAGAIVSLYDEFSGTFIESTITDQSGAFSFTGLNKIKTFFIVVKNTNPAWEHRISSRRQPS